VLCGTVPLPSRIIQLMSKAELRRESLKAQEHQEKLQQLVDKFRQK
jgi:hypothetical protein